ncbi:MAG TPA: transposase, partial [Tepidisphaeraceae bacterium]|nr:transposase [Tepidisphaeraceae bacterium]
WSYPRFVGAQSRVVFPAEGWSVMGRKGSHSEQFRLEACKLVSEQGYSIIEAAKQLDVPYNTLWNWLARYGPRLSTSQESDQQTSDDPGLLKNRIRELEKQVHRLEMEKEILKKATAYFAQEQT